MEPGFGGARPPPASEDGFGQEVDLGWIRRRGEEDVFVAAELFEGPKKILDRLRVSGDPPGHLLRGVADERVVVGDVAMRLLPRVVAEGEVAERHDPRIAFAAGGRPGLPHLRQALGEAVRWPAAHDP